MNVYRVKNRTKFLPLMLIVLFTVVSCAHQRTHTFLSPAEDGEYYTSVEDSRIVIWVEKGYLKGIFYDSITDHTRIKADARFFPCNAVGSANADDYLEKTSAYLCQSKTVAINTKDEKLKYYVVIYGKMKDCWYKCK